MIYEIGHAFRADTSLCRRRAGLREKARLHHLPSEEVRLVSDPAERAIGAKSSGREKKAAGREIDHAQ
jgi:hypothetical protein